MCIKSYLNEEGLTRLKKAKKRIEYKMELNMLSPGGKKNSTGLGIDDYGHYVF